MPLLKIKDFSGANALNCEGWVKGETPLHTAAMYAGEKQIPEGEWIPVAELLLAGGADVNARDNSGMTPLHLVASASTQDKYTAMAELLLARGADVNARDKSGMTPLHLAVKVEHKGMVDFLVAKGADINAKDNEGKTPLLYASETIRMSSALAAPLTLLPGEDPFTGTWQLNVAKSSYRPGPPPRSSINTYQLIPERIVDQSGFVEQEGRLKVINKSVDAHGTPGGFTRVEILDGKAHDVAVRPPAHPNAVAESNPSYDGISAKRIDRDTIEVRTYVIYSRTRFAESLMDTSIVTRKISMDGRMMIVTENRGAAFRETRVFDKLCGNEICQ